jgi:cytoskeletal protein RodZ
MKDIFDTIKERLLGYPSDLDLDREWAALNQRRAKKHRQGSRRRLSTVLLLLLFVGSCGSLLWIKMRPVSEALAPVPSDPAQKPNAVASNPVVSSNPVATAPQTSLKVAESNQTTSGISTLPTVKNNTFAPNTPERTHQVNTSSVANNYKATDPMSISAPEAATNYVSNVLFANDGTQPVTAKADPETTVTSASTARTNDPVSLLSARSIVAPAMAIVVIPALPTPYPLITQEPAIIIKKQAPSTLFSVFVGGGWLGSQQRFRVADGQSEPYAALRRSTETALPSFTFNAGVQRALGKKGFVEASLHYNKSYERLNYSFDQPKDYTYTNVLLSVVRIEGFGPEARTYGDTVIAGTQTVRIVHYNQFTSMNLRLTVGRQLLQAGRFTLSAGAGIDGSILSRAKGIVAAPAPAIGTIDLKEVYKSRFGLGISAVTRFEYQLHPKYALHLTPGAVWWMGNSLNTNGQLEAQWRQMSITAGLMHRF